MDYKNLKAPICTVVGHVDHGKSSILDYIRGTNIIKGEAGGITQAIGASFIPISRIIKLSKGLIKDESKIKIPGILFIDTPGHEAFTTLRKRGGSLSDLAILVVDINEGFKPQTYEALNILKAYKTPFIVAANKIDLIPGWKSSPNEPLISVIKKQESNVIEDLEKKTYELVGVLYKEGLKAERYDRIDDFTKEIAIVPVSAKTGEGISELLMLLIGLSQKFLNLKFNKQTGGKGTVLELKKINGIGYVIDIILYDGVIKKGDSLIIGGINDVIVTKVKSILKPQNNYDLRDKKTKFKYEDKVKAANGVRIISSNLETVIAGMPLIIISQNNVNNDKINEAKKSLISEVKDVFIDSDSEGVIIKADSIGSLEAMIMLLKIKKIKIRKASVGDIMKKDIFEAYSNKRNNRLYGVILGFNVNLSKEAKDEMVHFPIKIINSNIIYEVIEKYTAWLKEEKEKIESEEKKALKHPVKIKIIPNYIFRQSNPAIVGVDIIAGKLVKNAQLMNKEGNIITSVEGIQDNKTNLDYAESGKQVAVSLSKVTVGRQITKSEVLYSSITESEFRKLKENKNLLTDKEIEVLKEIAEIMRKNNPLWGL